jgi:hypothetical protein
MTLFLYLDVDFQKKGETIFKATTWVGYVGILTGMRVENGYSVSVNFRHTGGALTANLKTALARLNRFPIRNRNLYLFLFL